MSTSKVYKIIKFTKNLAALYLDGNAIEILILQNDSVDNLRIHACKFKGWCFMDYKARGIAVPGIDEGNIYTGPIEILQVMALINQNEAPLPTMNFDLDDDENAGDLFYEIPVENYVQWTNTTLVEAVLAPTMIEGAIVAAEGEIANIPYATGGSTLHIAGFSGSWGPRNFDPEHEVLLRLQFNNTDFLSNADIDINYCMLIEMVIGPQ